jgi:hypothetical protein
MTTKPKPRTRIDQERYIRSLERSMATYHEMSQDNATAIARYIQKLWTLHGELSAKETEIARLQKEVARASRRRGAR